MKIITWGGVARAILFTAVAVFALATGVLVGENYGFRMGLTVGYNLCMEGF